MGSSSPSSAPPPPPPKATPIVDDKEIRSAIDDERRRLGARKGRAGTFLVQQNGEGRQDAGMKTLLGQ